MNFFKNKPYLCHQDADNHTQLMQRAKGSSDSGGSNLPHVHGDQTSAQATEKTDD